MRARSLPFRPLARPNEKLLFDAGDDAARKQSPETARERTEGASPAGFPWPNAHPARSNERDKASAFLRGACRVVSFSGGLCCCRERASQGTESKEVTLYFGAAPLAVAVRVCTAHGRSGRWRARPCYVLRLWAAR